MILVKKTAFRTGFLVLFLLFTGFSAVSQRYLSDIDSSFFIKDTVRPIIKRFENLRFTGYIQPQFQIAQSAGAPSYAGGSFSTFSQSRFMLRRARVKMDYLLPSRTKFPLAVFSFQIDATERGVVVRDMFLKLYENRKNTLSLTTGIFARPFGYEVNLSSAFRETPERGRMSQILMPTERDLGLMASFEPQDKKHPLSHFKFDLGFFNGQGLSGTTDFDSHKDVISRLFIKPYKFNKLEFTGGLSLLLGGWKNGTKYVYSNSKNASGDVIFTVDSSITNLEKTAERHYYGADLQVKLHHGWGETEWRAEYWGGEQPGTATSTTNPGAIPTTNGVPLPTYLRHFDGAFLLFLQNIINQRHQLMLKYDWYDPNTNASKTQIGKSGTNLTTADIRFSTIGVGYGFQVNPQTRLTLYYDIVKNERTEMAGFKSDLKDNILTCRLHFRF